MQRTSSFLLLLTLAISLHAQPSLPDSLLAVREKLEDILKGIEQCEQVIVTSDDLELRSSTLERLRDSRNRLQASYPLSDYDDLWNILTRFDNCDKRIAERVTLWEQNNRRQTIIDKMKDFSHSFDSLLAVGEKYASHKDADSVKSIKLRADDQWNKVLSLKASAEDEFERDSLKAIYSRVERVRAQIQDLSEKEKMKPRDLLLVIAAVVAALAMLLTFTRSIKLTKKSKETPSIEI